ESNRLQTPPLNPLPLPVHGFVCAVATGTDASATSATPQMTVLIRVPFCMSPPCPKGERPSALVPDSSPRPEEVSTPEDRPGRLFDDASSAPGPQGLLEIVDVSLPQRRLSIEPLGGFPRPERLLGVLPRIVPEAAHRLDPGPHFLRLRDLQALARQPLR